MVRIDRKDMNERIPVNSVKRAFDIVGLLDERGGASFANLVAHLDAPESTVHDYLRTLQTMGYVVKTDGEYHVGMAFLRIGNNARERHEIYQVAKPELQKVADHTGEHASLTIEENGLGVLLYVTKGENAVRIGETTGEHLPLTVTAPGKAILAHMDPDAVERVLDDHGFQKRTEASITTRAELFKELETVRDQGYATELGEAVVGVRAISVPIRDRDDVHGAVTVGGPSRRMSGDWFRRDLPELLLRTSNVIEVNFSNAR